MRQPTVLNCYGCDFMYCVYKHVNKTNGRVYIGISSNLSRRWSNKGYKYISSPVFYNAIKKYGWDGFDHIVIKDNLTKEEACEMEKLLIKQNKDICYNVSDGGDSGPALFGEQNPNYHKSRSEDHCKKLSMSLTGHKTSEETKQKISENNKMKRRIKCIETDECFDSISLAAEKHNTFVENIWRAVSGKRKSWHGLHFIYI